MVLYALAVATILWAFHLSFQRFGKYFLWTSPRLFLLLYYPVRVTAVWIFLFLMYSYLVIKHHGKSEVLIALTIMFCYAVIKNYLKGKFLAVSKEVEQPGMVIVHGR